MSNYKEMLILYFLSIVLLTTFMVAMSGVSQVHEIIGFSVATAIFWSAMLAPMIPNKSKIN